MENMDESEREKLELSEGILADLETKMSDAGFGDRAEEAKVLYLLGLVDHGKEENFCDTLVGCFSNDQTDEELLAAVNSRFGTSITREDFTHAMEKYRT